MHFLSIAQTQKKFYKLKNYLLLLEIISLMRFSNEEAFNPKK